MGAAVLVDEASARKARGAFYTPPELGRYLARWAVRAASDRVLEPSCGDASLLEQAALRLKGLGTSSTDMSKQLRGVEIHHASAAMARASMTSLGLEVRIDVKDFFSSNHNNNTLFDQ